MVLCNELIDGPDLDFVFVSFLYFINWCVAVLTLSSQSIYHCVCVKWPCITLNSLGKLIICNDGNDQFCFCSFFALVLSHALKHDHFDDYFIFSPVLQVPRKVHSCVSNTKPTLSSVFIMYQCFVCVPQTENTYTESSPVHNLMQTALVLPGRILFLEDIQEMRWVLAFD